MLIGLVQQVIALFFADGAGVAVLDQGVRRRVEGHTDIHGGVAIGAHMPFLVAAVAHTDADFF